MYICNYDYEAINGDFKLGGEGELFHLERISEGLVRIKNDENNCYVGFKYGEPYYTDRSDDNTLILYRNECYFTTDNRIVKISDGHLWGMEYCAPHYHPNLIIACRDDILYNRFKREGIVTWRFDHPDETILDSARNKILREGHTRISEIITRGWEFKHFLKDPILRGVLDRVFSDSYHLTTYSTNTLRREDGDNRNMHTDYPYHDLEPPYPDKILGIQIILALDDFTRDNGATIYIPRSFQARKYPDVNSDWVRKDRACMTVPKGTIILFRGDLWHSQGINNTNNPRVAVLANFSPSSVPAKDDMNSQARYFEEDSYFMSVNGQIRFS